MGPACGCLCLTLLFETTRYWNDKKLAPTCSLQASKRWLRHTETQCHWGTDQALACGCLCLTLLSEPTRNSSKLHPSLQNGAEAPCYSRTDQALGLQLPVPIIAFWADKKLAPNCNLQASSLLVPNVAFWTDKKLASNCSLQASKTVPSPHRNTMLLKDGPVLLLLLLLLLFSFSFFFLFLLFAASCSCSLSAFFFPSSFAC